MEPYEKRLARFKNNPPEDFISTILNSIANFFLPQLSVASEKGLPHLLILGIHSVIETISEKIFLKRGMDGFKFYLENFVDADKDGFRFSEIAKELNDRRNIVAHQWISQLGHSFGFDFNIQVGYQREDNVIILNPSMCGL